jgi:hypothetical protein
LAGFRCQPVSAKNQPAMLTCVFTHLALSCEPRREESLCLEPDLSSLENRHDLMSKPDGHNSGQTFIGSRHGASSFGFYLRTTDSRGNPRMCLCGLVDYSEPESFQPPSVAGDRIFQRAGEKVAIEFCYFRLRRTGLYRVGSWAGLRLMPSSIFELRCTRYGTSRTRRAHAMYRLRFRCPDVKRTRYDYSESSVTINSPSELARASEQAM